MIRMPAVLRPNRLEITGTLILAAAMVLIGGGIAASSVIGPWLAGFPANCLGADTIDVATACEPFRPRIDTYWSALQNVIPAARGMVIALPIIGAFTLGLALLARELEQQTALFGWSLSPSRSRWLLGRLGPEVLLVAVICLVAGALVDAIQSLGGFVDPWRSFEGFGVRGPALAGIGVMALGLTVFVGGFLGRQLPALLASLALTLGAGLLVSAVSDSMLDKESVVGTMEEVDPGARQLAGLLRTAEGEDIDWEEAYNRYGSAIYEGNPEDLGLTQVARYVPGDRYPFAVFRLTGLLALVGAIGIALSLLIVQRRRPWA
jgi:hypothetical protein